MNYIIRVRGSDEQIGRIMVEADSINMTPTGIAFVRNSGVVNAGGQELPGQVVYYVGHASLIDVRMEA
jgi:hypothetical protein